MDRKSFIISKIKNIVSWTYIINDLNGDEIARTFDEKGLHKTHQEELRIEKVVKRTGNKICIKWKDYENFFNCWIDKKSIV